MNVHIGNPKYRWARDQAFRQNLDMRLAALADTLAASRQDWPGLKIIFADVTASGDASMRPADLGFRAGEMLLRLDVDAARIAEIDAARHPAMIEIGLLQGLVCAAWKYGLNSSLFEELLTLRMREARVENPGDIGLPLPLSPEDLRKGGPRRSGKKAPKLIRIRHDDHHARHVGRTAGGIQFFLTNPFVPAVGGTPGREFIALYLFDASGALSEARIEDLGTRAGLSESLLEERRSALLGALGKVKYGTIRVAPFIVQRFGQSFGLIPHEPEFDDDDWSVTVEPGDYMAFYPPWSGEYDT